MPGGLRALVLALAVLVLVAANGTPPQEASSASVPAAMAGPGPLVSAAPAAQGPADPQLPAFLQGRVDKADYLARRAEAIGRLRGVEPGKPFDPSARGRALQEMRQQLARQKAAAGPLDPEPELDRDRAGADPQRPGR